MLLFSTKMVSSRLLSKNLKIKIYKTITLLDVLYSCETWSLALREEGRLRLFGKRYLMRIFLPKKDENGRWKRFCTEGLCSLHCSLYIVRVNKSRILKWAEHLVRMRERKWNALIL